MNVPHDILKKSEGSCKSGSLSDRGFRERVFFSNPRFLANPYGQDNNVFTKNVVQTIGVHKRGKNSKKEDFLSYFFGGYVSIRPAS